MSVRETPGQGGPTQWRSTSQNPSRSEVPPGSDRLTSLGGGSGGRARVCVDEGWLVSARGRDVVGVVGRGRRDRVRVRELYSLE